ncbi:N-acetyl sugar amidotransferase [uncultured Desulfuromusa sp.]|uniref:N-acetyl sugar amidotransferase n=1 Tax=uncultured Desulfuromusa sp. TaxID=219183 RepID=UPI002AA8C50D|nr:N-acetyl sugar amidotransferase [uncultured Desulfuromusa sp.]
MDVKRCAKCILDENFPHIQFDSSGICNYCHSWDAKWGKFDYTASEQKLKSIFDQAKQKQRKYDCLVPFSGGRDSSYVLYLCKKKYGLNPMAVTFNNTFMSDYALKNIFHTVSSLGVDHIMVSYQPDQLKQFYRTMILNGGEFCSICTSGINYVTILYQRMFDIPLVISGTSSRVDEQSPFEVTSSHPSYVRKVLTQNGFSIDSVNSLLIKRQYEQSTIEKIKLKLRDADFININMPDYLPWDNQEIQSVLEEKLNWLTPNKDKDHIDCRFSTIKSHLKNKQIPHFIFKQEKYSQLIRDGQMTRDDAMQLLNDAIKTESQPPEEFIEFLNFFEINEEQVANNERRSHLNYITKEDTILKETMAFKLFSIPWKIVKLVKK